MPRIEICGVCGCLHRSIMGDVCYSCYDAMLKVEGSERRQRIDAALAQLSEMYAQCGYTPSGFDAGGRLLSEKVIVSGEPPASTRPGAPHPTMHGPSILVRWWTRLKRL